VTVPVGRLMPSEALDEAAVEALGRVPLRGHHETARTPLHDHALTKYMDATGGRPITTTAQYVDDALHVVKAAILSGDGRWQRRCPPPIPVLNLVPSTMAA
jgi:hypothetical protein